MLQDDVGREGDQFRRVFANSVGIGNAPTGIDADVAAVDPAQLRELLQECRHAGLKLWIVRGARHQHPDAPHSLLLRARRERPRRSAANHLDEVTPSHAASEPQMQNEQYHTTLWRVGSRKGAQGGILDGWLEKVRGRFPKAVARSFRGRVYSPRFKMSGNLAMLDATRLASSIVICFASMASASVERP